MEAADQVPPGKRPCPNCAGKGEIVQYSHYHQGICFLCKGSGLVKAKRPAAARPRAAATAPTGDLPEWYTADPDNLPF